MKIIKAYTKCDMWNVLDNGSDLVKGKYHGHQIINPNVWKAVVISICTNQTDWTANTAVPQAILIEMLIARQNIFWDKQNILEFLRKLDSHLQHVLIV